MNTKAEGKWPETRWNLFDPAALYLASVVLGIGILFLMSKLGMPTNVGYEGILDKRATYAQLTYEGVKFLATVTVFSLLMIVWRRASWASMGFRRPERSLEAAGVVCAVAPLLWFFEWRSLGGRAVTDGGVWELPADLVPYGSLLSTIAGTLIVIGFFAVLTSIVEETLFRGLLYHYLRSRMRWWLAVPISAAVFAGLHRWESSDLWSAFITGVACAVLVERYRSLYVAMALHGLQNAVYVALSRLHGLTG